MPSKMVAEARVPVQHRLGGEVAHLAIEQPLLIADAGNQAAGMAVRKVGHHFGEQLQCRSGTPAADRPTAAGRARRCHRTDGHWSRRNGGPSAGERVLVPEVIKEAALGETGFCDNFLDRGGAEIPWRARLLPRSRGFAPRVTSPFPIRHSERHGKTVLAVRICCAHRRQRLRVAPYNLLISYHFSARGSAVPRAC